MWKILGLCTFQLLFHYCKLSCEHWYSFVGKYGPKHFFPVTRLKFFFMKHLVNTQWNGGHDWLSLILISEKERSTSRNCTDLPTGGTKNAFPTPPRSAGAREGEKCGKKLYGKINYMANFSWKRDYNYYWPDPNEGQVLFI